MMSSWSIFRQLSFFLFRMMGLILCVFVFRRMVVRLSMLVRVNKNNTTWDDLLKNHPSNWKLLHKFAASQQFIYYFLFISIVNLKLTFNFWMLSPSSTTTDFPRTAASRGSSRGVAWRYPSQRIQDVDVFMFSAYVFFVAYYPLVK